MTREDKIKAIQLINEGVPIQIAINGNKPIFLFKELDENLYYTNETGHGKPFTESEYQALSKLIHVIVCENVAKSYYLGKKIDQAEREEHQAKRMTDLKRGYYTKENYQSHL